MQTLRMDHTIKEKLETTLLFGMSVCMYSHQRASIHAILHPQYNPHKRHILQKRHTLDKGPPAIPESQTATRAADGNVALIMQRHDQ